MPIRIQRKRTAGWRMPENTVSVTRPGPFGNPFVVGGYFKIGNGGNGMTMIRALEEKYADKSYTILKTAQEAVDMFREYKKRYPYKQEEIAKIKGKDLACWCKPGDPCHADVLLEIANS
jgi:Domain of unknown function (DUF4326)